MKSFIQVTEIWLPSADGEALEFGSGLYGALSAFKETSQQTRFALGEGLPGKAWQQRRPIVLKNFTNSYFMRTEAAHAAGLTCGVALPIFKGAAIQAVVVFLCSDDVENVGALEVWLYDSELGSQMAQVDGYYGSAELFEWTSKRTKFGKGVGLPGLVWEKNAPVIVKNYYQPDRFLRWEEAQKIGVNVGLGIPCPYDPPRTWIMTFLSALGTPIAERFEVWMPDASLGVLKYQSGTCSRNSTLSMEYAARSLSQSDGFIGKTWALGQPVTQTEFRDHPEWMAKSVRDAGLTSSVAIPVFNADASLNSIVAWYF